ncbi:crotonobetainyl-CoA:carnitine CoA-transferase CaiB-like acyl-CoA transferase [Antricoccus suffuscus]|uniref:Crotonobetainyl-CoA:carnitine CoA-transferase CaiB-like acyl-CoA transferase n=1 Tax=Antricoccus suffuscus TaxID=1629062 RepID=A0A2T0ZX52_9ACTN|nr:CoA transferase [Antricoccus suffuscus]PRZ40854.1 crotonobetainyl-CoA:carnitine CoA-transferase CaiB-like acyl-CoA transferase [Antricoccus suffuscus]
MIKRMSPDKLPLTGVRIMDMTHVWSGPMATRVLAGLGAEVIKLESPNKPDALRGNKTDVALRYPNLTPGEDSINRNAWYNTQNVDKKGVVVDLKTAEGMDIARQLVATSDVVIANYRPGVLDRMGLGFDELKVINPKIVLVEMPGYTADSPQAAAPAFGAQFDAQSGAATLTGGQDGPLLTGYAIGDPAAGLMAGNAVVTALLRRNRTGAPGHIVLAQSEAMMPLLGEYYLAESVGESIREEINADRRFVPHGLYRTGDGGWLAIAATSDAQWRKLREVLVDVDANLAGIETLREREGAARQIDDALRTYAAAIADAAAGAQDLQTLGVPAAPMQGAKAICADPQLAHSAYFKELQLESVGTHSYPGLPICIDGERIGTRTPAPRFKEDTAAVMTKVVGLSDQQIIDLGRRGVLGLLDQ